MTHPRFPESAAACRAEAQRLLKELRGADPARARAAATRFVRLRSFAAGGPDGVLAQRARVRLKHALSVIADVAAVDPQGRYRATIAAAQPGSYVRIVME